MTSLPIILPAAMVDNGGVKDKPRRLTELAGLFLKLGVIGFGGPAAHIAMMEEEVVGRRSWLNRERFLDLVGATNLIPGPNSTERALHIGFLRAGWAGLVVSGVAFILPSVLLTGGVAWMYVSFGTLPSVEPLLRGIKPAVYAVIVSALVRLSRTAFSNVRLTVIGGCVLIASLLGLQEVLVLLVGGILGAIWVHLTAKKTTGGSNSSLISAPVLAGITGLSGSFGAGAVGVTLWSLGLVFLKVGAVLYGSGYVLVAFLQSELVEMRGWLTQQQLLDAIAIGQFTPGPVLSTATFVGYQILGFKGALVATVAIFLPSFFFVALLNPLLPVLRRRAFTAAFLDAVNASSVALIAAVSVKLLAVIVTDWMTLLIATGAALLGIRYRLHAAWLVLGGGVLGWVFSMVGIF